MIVFKTLYYGFGLILAFIELAQVKNLDKVSEKMRDFADFSKMKKNCGEEVKWDEVPSDVKSVVLFKVILTLVEIFWLVFGLFTFNWAFFASYMVYIWISNKLFHGARPSTEFYMFRTTMFILFVLFVLINSFHLKIDFFSLF